jgi:hypothetical protein
MDYDGEGNKTEVERKTATGNSPEAGIVPPIPGALRRWSFAVGWR